MIQIKGKIAGVDFNSAPAYIDILVGTNDSFIGHRVHCTKENTSYNAGDSVRLHTTLILKEESKTIYGFRSKEEKSFFELLLKSSGIGGNTALFIMDNINSVDELADAILNEDLDYFTKIKGIGEKTAIKMIRDLKKKVKGIM